MPILDATGLSATRDPVVDAQIEAETIRDDIAAALATFHHSCYKVPALMQSRGDPMPYRSCSGSYSALSRTSGWESSRSTTLMMA